MMTSPPAPDGPVGFTGSAVDTLEAADGRSGARFGKSVAISSDGATVAVGAPNTLDGAGMVYVFTRSAASWIANELGPADFAGGNSFGWSVALSADGTTLAAGASGRWDGSGEEPASTGTVYVYTRASADPSAPWTQQAELVPPPASVVLEYAGFLGASVALSADGDTLAAGEPGFDADDTGSANTDWLFAGAVDMYSRSGSTWTEVQRVTPAVVRTSNNFGDSISLSGDGTLLAVGAPGEASQATGIDGDADDGSLPGAGAAYLFALGSDGWTQQHYLKPQLGGTGEANFGFAVALSRDGATLAVGASNQEQAAGAVYAFGEQVTGAWAQLGMLQLPVNAPGAGLGASVALSADGTALVAGAPTGNVVMAAGFDGATWTAPDPLVASPAVPTFGASVALSDDGATLAVGAQDLEDFGAGPGAAYVYAATTLPTGN